MADRPANYTADRADRLQAGMFVHTQQPLLSEDAPADGWLEVDTVESGVTGTLVVVGGESVFFPSDKIVYLGYE